MKRILVLTICFSVLLSSCRLLSGRSIRGDGNVVSETRDLSGFDGVQAGGAVNVYVKQGPTHEVRVETDQNLQEFIETYVEGNTLFVRQANNTSLDPTQTVKIYVTSPEYYSLGVSGASNLYSEGRIESSKDLDIEITGASSAKLDVKAPVIDLDMSGASNAELKGETRDLKVDGSGASGLKAFGLLAENVNVEISGAGNVEVNASVKLDARTSGASSVEYRGAAAVNSEVSGAGSVKKRD